MTAAIGIDLGTTNSVCAVATPYGVKFANDENGLRVFPSVVYYPTSGEPLVGANARVYRANDPANTIYSAKRLIGQNIRGGAVQLALASLPYHVEEGANQQPVINVRGQSLTIPEISAEVLRYLADCSAELIGETPQQAVVTVPANFADAQRQATREAGRLAGLDVLRLVNEPTAAALAYGFGQGCDDIVVVFDFGGGTFDVSVLKIRGEIFEVLATDGDFFLGGDDIDRALAEHLASEMNRTLKVDPRPHRELMTRLRIAAEEVKCYLSHEYEAAGAIDGLEVEGGGEELSLPFSVNRQQFERLIEGYVDQTVTVCRNVLTASGVSPEEISEVICVGGSTRIPLVRERVADLFGREPSLRINPDEVVGQGAAIQASLLAGNQVGVTPEADAPAAGGSTLDDDLLSLPDVPSADPAAPINLEELGSGPVPAAAPAVASALLLDVNQATLSVATAGGFTEALVEKNAPIPIEKTQVFTTARENQTRVVVECCRGEERKYEENEPLGSLTLEDLPEGPRGDVRIAVTFRVDGDGILHVRAVDEKTGQEQEAHLNVLGAPVQEEEEAAAS